MRVLLIEDDPALQRATTRLIHRALGSRAAVSICGTAGSAAFLLGACMFDLILSDYDLGTSTGADVLEYLRDRQPEMVDRFVFFSGTDGLTKIHPKVIEKGIDVETFVQQLQGYLP